MSATGPPAVGGTTTPRHGRAPVGRRREADTGRAAQEDVPAGDAPAREPGAAAAGAERHRGRVVALDAVRGLAIVILLLAMHPGNREVLPAQLRHAEWVGLTFADTFFPLFLFAVGAAMPFSRRSQRARTVLRRALVLSLLGVVILTIDLGHVPGAGGGVLQHIAIAYVLAWGLTRLPRRLELPVLVALVGGAWAAFALLHAPGADPWGTSGTFGHRVDGAVFGGWTAEGIVPSVLSLVNVMAGVQAGRWVRAGLAPRVLLGRVAAAGAVLVIVGVAMAPAVPVIKWLWTPSYTVLTAGITFLYFALAVALFDLYRLARLAHPFVVLGSNPLAVYVASMIAASLLNKAGRWWIDPVERIVDPHVLTLVHAVAWLAVGYAVLAALYRRGIHIRV